LCRAISMTRFARRSLGFTVLSLRDS
jgi:hypothetical protein